MHSFLVFQLKGRALFLWFVFQASVAWAQNSSSELPQRGLCAHRGAMETHPENTLPALLEAVRLGAHMIEFDIQTTRDGVMVIMHDLTVDRTTTGTGKVSELTFQEIKALDAGVKKDVKFRGTRVPTFQEVLDQMPANVWLNCHLKGEESEGSQAALLLLASGRIHQAFLTCSEKAAEGARKAVPNVKICNVEGRYRKDTPKYASETIRLKSDFIQLLRPAPGEQRDATIGLLRKHGVKINCFYADTPEEAATMWRSGIDFPLVNDFGAFLSVLNQEGIKPVTPLFDK